jgi:hypothetical protein
MIHQVISLSAYLAYGHNARHGKDIIAKLMQLPQEVFVLKLIAMISIAFVFRYSYSPKIRSAAIPANDYRIRLEFVD